MSEVDTFIADLAKVRLANAFNPYSEICDEHDKRDAPAIRRRNLRLVLEAGLADEVKSLWLGRDLGHRGGRRTGLPLTDERHLSHVEKRMGTRGLAKATRTAEVAERTAVEVWQAVDGLREVPMFWNAFPLHPHEIGDPTSNRKHSRAEAQATEHFLREMLRMFKPRRLIALGNDAHVALKRLGVSAVLVRHPSYGGQSDFRRGIREAYL